MTDDPLEHARTVAFIADVRAAVDVLDRADFTQQGNVEWGNARAWIVDNAERIARTLAAVEIERSFTDAEVASPGWDDLLRRSGIDPEQPYDTISTDDGVRIVQPSRPAS